jgi:hypothetical protein
MQADMASSSMAAEHDACKKPEPCKALQQSLHSAVDLTLPEILHEGEPQVPLIMTTTVLTRMSPTILHASTSVSRSLPSLPSACRSRR